MAKGDGWAVKRYVCPRCNRKGLYKRYYMVIGHPSKMGCMYKNCESQKGTMITWEEVLSVNPELKTESVRWKP
jgi:hypothetical protein